MKKMIIAFALTAMAFAAQADLVNGDFNSAAAGETVGGNASYTMLGNGWYTNTVNARWVISGNGVADRTDGNNNAYAGMAQLFTYSGDGARTLRMNYTSTDADADNDWVITFWGYNQTGASTSLLSAEVFNLGNTNSIAGGGNYAVTEIYKAVELNIGSFGATNYDINFTADSAYEFYAIRIQAKSVDNADVFTINSVTVVPEPATVGMLGLGSLVALMIRRMRG